MTRLRMWVASCTRLRNLWQVSLLPITAVALVVRYVLETCDDVAGAREAIARIPVHAPQNLTLLDRTGAYVTTYVGPGREPRFVDVAATTNHQGEVEWPEYAEAIRSEERERRVLALLDEDRQRFEDAFLEPPLYSRDHAQGFGTIYTAGAALPLLFGLLLASL